MSTRHGFDRAALVTGTLFALAAGLMWGLVFITPLLLPQYPAALLSFARYLAFGLIALPLAWWDRARIAQLTAADWREAGKLALIGNVLYYLFLAAAIQRAGAPLPSMIIGTLPVVIALYANVRNAQRDGRLAWRQLLPSLSLIIAGIALVNEAEWRQFAAAHAGASADAVNGAVNDAVSDAKLRYLGGAMLAVVALACWTWYPMRNADWLRAHPERSSSTWATAQGIATLPLALIGLASLWLWDAVLPLRAAGTGAGGDFAMPWGPTPWRFVALMLTIGLFASWLGTLCWNEASQRLPTSVAGQLIVFETLAALAYAFVLRSQWPTWTTLAGVALLLLGVVSALRLKPMRAHPVPAPP